MAFSATKSFAIVRHLIRLVVLITICGSTLWAQPPQPPATRVDSVVEKIHGVDVPDPYRWLEDQNSPETRAWIATQNSYTQAVLKNFPSGAELRKQITQWMKIGSVSTPISKGGRYFYTKRGPDQDQAVIYVREGLNGAEQALLDPAKSGDAATSVDILSVSFDGKLLAYGRRRGGADEQEIVLFDVDKRAELADRIPKGSYWSAPIAPDKSGLYYASFSPSTGSQVYFHRLGTKSESDQEIFGKDFGPGFITTPTLSSDGRYLLFTVSRLNGGTQVFVQNLEQKGPITPIIKDIDATFVPAIGGDHLYLATNWEAPNGRVLDVDLKNPERARWRVVVPEGARQMDISLFGQFAGLAGKLFVEYLENAVPTIKIYEPSGTYVGDLPFPVAGSLQFGEKLSGDWNQDEVFYAFTSYAIPTCVYRYLASTGRQQVWDKLRIPISSDEIELKQVWYESKDKTKIPMFLVYKKGLRLDGNNPVLMTGYGGFGISFAPTYQMELFPAAFWAAHGGVFAVASLRGGGEFGEKWHNAGMLDKKQNGFDDFIAAAEWLVKNKYTRPSRLAIMGDSNGGLLVGATAMQRPDLFRAVASEFPVLDMLRYQDFLTGPMWVPEYGSAEDPKQFPYLYAYSPYHNVRPGTKYPAMIFVSGDSDTRVSPMHARKMVARVQAATSSGNPVILDYDTLAGHLVGLSVAKQIETMTDVMSFLFLELGMAP